MDKVIAPTGTAMPQPLQEYILKAGEELRISNIEDHIKVLLLDGKAEVFGKEMPIEMPIFFHQGEKLAIYTYQGAKFIISGKSEAYVSGSTPMQFYINVHSAINQLRNQALKTRQIGPSVLITGQHQIGKSTLCKILVNYSLKLGWTPIFVDLDLNNNEISTPGNLSAAVVEEPLPNDDLVANAINFFHGSFQPVTLEFFDRQVQELATAVKSKLQNDLHQFNSDHQIESKMGDTEKGQEEIAKEKELQKFVAPPYPELFSSGTIINGFTPQDRRETESLVEAIRQFKVNIVLVVDHEKLENDIRMLLNDRSVQIIQLPKSGGVQKIKFDEKYLYEKYQEYFRGKYYSSYSKKDSTRLTELGPEALMCRNEFDPQDIKIAIEDFKIYEIHGREIPLSALPAGSTSPRWTTDVQEVRIQDMQQIKHKVLAILVPSDLQRLKKLEIDMALNSSNNASYKEEFNDIIMRSCCAGLMQVKEYHDQSNENFQTLKTNEERKLEVRTIISNEQIPSNYLLVSKFKLQKIV